jgi:hypothetical protein
MDSNAKLLFLLIPSNIFRLSSFGHRNLVALVIKLMISTNSPEPEVNFWE